MTSNQVRLFSVLGFFPPSYPYWFYFLNMKNITMIIKVKTNQKGILREVKLPPIPLLLHFPHLLQITNFFVFWVILPVFVFIMISRCVYISLFSLPYCTKDTILHILFALCFFHLTITPVNHFTSVHRALPRSFFTTA